QEIIGTRGEVPDAIQIVDSVEAIDTLQIDDPDTLIYLTQTTLSMDDASVIIQALRNAFPNIHEPPSDDICYATTNRQLAVRQLAPQCDLVIVVGSRNSSNSKRLRELAEASGTPAVLVDDRSELTPELISGSKRVLVTAGASAPEDLVQQLILYLIESSGDDVEVEQYDVFHEDIEFGLPGTLKTFMRERGIDPAGRRITMDNITATAKFLTSKHIPHRVVDLTVGASS
ncbi:MAG: hypothetical protein QGG74_04795, partial [Phycisphaerales bacterium]|nr:hypothetical protein [Phycisphaerales bacterium]